MRELGEPARHQAAHRERPGRGALLGLRRDLRHARRVGRDGRSGRRQPRAGGAGQRQARRLEHAAGRAAAADVVGQGRSQEDRRRRHRERRAGCARRPARPSMPWAAPGARSPACTWSRRAIRCTSSITTTSPAEEARAVARLIAVQSAKSLEKMPGVSRRRVDTLPLACLALDRLLAALKPRNVVFSAFGLREGFYYSRLQRGRARAPSADRLRRGAGRRLAALRPRAGRDLRLADAGLRRRERGRAHPAHRPPAI